MPCPVALEDHEWKALYGFVYQTAQMPPGPPSLRDATRMVASLGGFPGREGDGDLGAQTLWRGLQRPEDVAAAWRLFSAPRSPPSPRK